MNVASKEELGIGRSLFEGRSCFVQLSPSLQATAAAVARVVEHSAYVASMLRVLCAAPQPKGDAESGELLGTFGNDEEMDCPEGIALGPQPAEKPVWAAPQLASPAC